MSFPTRWTEAGQYRSTEGADNLSFRDRIADRDFDAAGLHVRENRKLPVAVVDHDAVAEDAGNATETALRAPLAGRVSEMAAIASGPPPL